MSSFDTTVFGTLLAEELRGGSYISVVIEKSSPTKCECLVLGHCMDEICIPRITLTDPLIFSTVTRNSPIRILDPDEVRKAITRRIRKRKSALDILTDMSVNKFKVLRFADFAQAYICNLMSVDEYCRESPDTINPVMKEEFKKIASGIGKKWFSHCTC